MKTYEGFINNTINKIKQFTSKTEYKNGYWVINEKNILESIGFKAEITDEEIAPYPNIYFYYFSDSKYTIILTYLIKTSDSGILSRLYKGCFNDNEEMFDKFSDVLEFVFTKEFQEYYLENYSQYVPALIELEKKKIKLIDQEVKDKYDYLFTSNELGLL